MCLCVYVSVCVCVLFCVCVHLACMSLCTPHVKHVCMLPMYMGMRRGATWLSTASLAQSALQGEPMQTHHNSMQIDHSHRPSDIHTKQDNPTHTQCTQQAKLCQVVANHFFIHCDIRRVVMCRALLLHLLRQLHQLHLDLVAQGQFMVAQQNFSDGGVLLKSRAVHPSHLN